MDINDQCAAQITRDVAARCLRMTEIYSATLNTQGITIGRADAPGCPLPFLIMLSHLCSLFHYRHGADRPDNSTRLLALAPEPSDLCSRECCKPRLVVLAGSAWPPTFVTGLDCAFAFPLSSSSSHPKHVSSEDMTSPNCDSNDVSLDGLAGLCDLGVTLPVHSGPQDRDYDAQWAAALVQIQQTPAVLACTGTIPSDGKENTLDTPADLSAWHTRLVNVGSDTCSDHHSESDGQNDDGPSHHGGGHEVDPVGQTSESRRESSPRVVVPTGSTSGPVPVLDRASSKRYRCSGPTSGAAQLSTVRPSRSYTQPCRGNLVGSIWEQAPEPMLHELLEATLLEHEAHGIGVIIKALAQQNGGVLLFLRMILVCVATLLCFAYYILVLGEAPAVLHRTASRKS